MTGCLSFFLKMHSLISDTEMEITHTLVYSPSVHISQQVRPVLEHAEARNLDFIQVCYVGSRGLSTGPSSIAFLDAFAGSWIGKGEFNPRIRLLWDASIIGNSLVSCSTTLAPRYIIFKVRVVNYAKAW